MNTKTIFNRATFLTGLALTSLVLATTAKSVRAQNAADSSPLNYSWMAAGNAYTFQGLGGNLLALSPDQSIIASSNTENIVKIWSNSEAKVIRTIATTAQRVWGITFSPDGSKIAILGWTYVDETNFASPNSALKFVTLEVRNVSDGSLVYSINSKNLNPYVSALPYGSQFAKALCYSPDGSQIVIAATESGTTTLTTFSASNGAFVKECTSSIDSPSKIEFLPDNRTLVVAGTVTTTRLGKVELWDMTTGRINQVLDSAMREAKSFAIKGNTLALAGRSGYGAMVEYWNLLDGVRSRALQGMAGGIYQCVAFRWDGNVVAGGVQYVGVGVSRTPVGLYEGWGVGDTAPEFSQTHNSPLNCLIPDSPSGLGMIAKDDAGTIQNLDCTTGNISRTITRNNGLVLRAAVSPDGTLSASGGKSSYESNRGSLRLWNTATGALLRDVPLKSQDYLIQAIQFTPNSQGLLYADKGQHNTITLLSATGDLVRDIPTALYEVQSIAFSPDGNSVALGGILPGSSTVRAVEVLETTDWQSQGVYATAYPTSSVGYKLLPVSVAFSSTGLVALGSAATQPQEVGGTVEGTIELFSIGTGQRTAGTLIHDAPFMSKVNALRFSPDGQRLFAGMEYKSGFLQVSGSADTYRVADLARVQRIATPEAVSTLDLLGTDRLLATGTQLSATTAASQGVLSLFNLNTSQALFRTTQETGMQIGQHALVPGNNQALIARLDGTTGMVALPQGVDLSLSTYELYAGTNSLTATATLYRPAPAGGLTLRVTYGPTYKVLSGPTTITIPAGQTQINFTVKRLKSVTIDTEVGLSVVGGGIRGGNSVTVYAPYSY
jgi:WD40 repeat protein